MESAEQREGVRLWDSAPTGLAAATAARMVRSQQRTERGVWVNGFIVGMNVSVLIVWIVMVLR